MSAAGTIAHASALALIALLGCTDVGVVGSVQDAHEDVLADAAPPGAVASDREDAEVPFDAASEPGADTPTVDVECMRRYTQCKLANLAALTDDVCVPDALACGALAAAEAIEIVCTRRHARCLEHMALDACARALEACWQDPWADAGTPEAGL